MSKKPKTAPQVLKPTLAGADAALEFSNENSQPAPRNAVAARVGVDTGMQKKAANGPKKQVSGLVPEGDVRLTANISETHHIKLKVAAAQQRTTVGELIERLIDQHL